MHSLPTFFVCTRASGGEDQEEKGQTDDEVGQRGDDENGGGFVGFDVEHVGHGDTHDANGDAGLQKEDFEGEIVEGPGGEADESGQG